MCGALRIAIASGKGGTGKTTVATSLAVVLAEAGATTAYVDCDVEEPNGHLFLKPTIRTGHEVSIPVPQVDPARCGLCGACGEACRYSAIVALPNKVLTFPKLCHGCGGCTLACVRGAIREVARPTGVVEEGVAGRVTFVHGRLGVGEAMAPPVIRAVLAAAPEQGTVIIDAAPGTSCPVVESVKRADVVLLVTEPTPFGLNDLKLAVEMVQQLGIPFGVAINRAGIGDGTVVRYCAYEQIPVLLVIPNDRAIACAYSRGDLAIAAAPELRPLFLALSDRLRELARTTRSPKTQRQVAPFTEAPAPATFSSELVQLGKSNGLRELVIISGKGGTGKTSIAASFVALAARAAAADCDVDAADLHLLLAPTVRERRSFSGGNAALVDPERCIGCGRCADQCRFKAIHARTAETDSVHEVETITCEGCGVCVDICPIAAVALVPSASGELFVSETRHGPMAHARLGIAQENSGKLVSLVRREAKVAARTGGCELLICDGSPGIGCPVIASTAGAGMVLVVTEPTVSGLHDLQRVAELCQQLETRAGLCVNKADINPELVAAIEADAARRGVPVLGRIGYDESVVTAQVRQLAVVENGDSRAARDIRALWERVRAALAAA
jgi:MinD superfamily P-loop ATPase